MIMPGFPRMLAMQAGGLSLVGFRTNRVLSSTVPVDVPAGVADGDLLVAVTHANLNYAPQALSGWTLAYSDSTSAPGIGIYTRVAASEPSSYSFAFSTSTGIRGSIIAFKGASSLPNIGAVGRSSGTTATAPSISLDPDGALISILTSGTASSTIVTPPSGMELIFATDDGSGSPVQAFYWLNPAPASPSGDRTITWSTAANQSGINIQVA